jgi:hypothetical protein
VVTSRSSGSPAERILLDAPVHALDAAGIVAQFGRVAAGPQADRARHRLLHVGVARQRRCALALRQAIERANDGVRAGIELIDRIAQIQPQGGEHLIVARAAEMDTPAGRSDARSEPAFQCRLAILVGELDVPQSTCMLLAERREPIAYELQIASAQQPLPVQHVGMRD